MNHIASRPYPDLKTWRRALGLNQQTAAKRLGISQTTYSRLERKLRGTRAAVAKRIMNETGVSLEVLMGVA